jgi:hypothetical protein
MVAELPNDPGVLAAVERFAREGFAPLDVIAERAVLEALDEQTQKAAGRGDAEASEKFGAHKGGLWSHAIDAAMTNGQLDGSSAFAAAGLQPRILAVIAHSLGLLPRLDYVTVTESSPMTGQPSHSQLWHRDHDDTRVIKVFVYLSDVSEEKDGPFTFLPASASDRVSFSWKSHRADEHLSPRVDLEHEVVRVMGPKFTCFMVETSRCLHMGSRVAPGHGRLMYTASYFAPPRIYPEPPKPFFRLGGSESAIERAVLQPDV